LGVAVAAIGHGALAAGNASAACPVDYCTAITTDSNGLATLKIPGKLVRLGYPQLQECTWDVVAEYGDGSPDGSYAFSEAIGLEAEHVYPEPGVYTFDAVAENGLHDGTSEPCPDVHIQATVTFHDPTPPVKDPEEPAPEEGPATPPGGGAPASQPPVAAPPAAAPAYWRGCGHGVRTHLVTCRKARKVVAAAGEHVTRARPPQGAVFQASGFSCRLRQGPTGLYLSCRRGSQRVLGP